MTAFTHTIDLPVDPAEAVKVLRRELRLAQHRLAEARRGAVFSAYRSRAQFTSDHATPARD